MARAPVKQPPKVQKVRATYKMDTETFVKHFNNRHDDSLAGLTALPASISYEVEMAYRAFHKRLHETRPKGDYEHEHLPDPPEAGIEWALHCLLSNNFRGWYEIAGANGVASCFPDGSIATRIRGIIQYHDNLDDAVVRLMGKK